MAKATIKRGKAKNKPSQPDEASSTTNRNKAGLALSTDDAGDTLKAAYKSAADNLSVVQEPYLAILPAAKHPMYESPLYESPLPAAKILNKQRLTCLITGVTATTITTDALIDRQNGIVQARRFDKLPLTGVINCKVGTLFNLTIVTRPGSREFIYQPGNADDRKYFEETLVDITSLRNDLKNDPTFRQEPDTDDGNTF